MAIVVTTNSNRTVTVYSCGIMNLNHFTISITQ